ncbi:MAG: hypothetical protein C0401_10260 [Anaerolinea sp.]|nr:hypothetical protein [Anaerolinea sp.]
MNISVSRLLRLWGKTEHNNNDPKVFHPILFHMLDVGHVAQALLNSSGSARWRRVLSHSLGIPPNRLGDWLPWFVAMHDIGKVSAAFQMINKNQYNRLRQEGFSFDGWIANWDVQHAVISQLYFADELTNDAIAPEKVVNAWSEAFGGHHGRYQHPDGDIKPARQKLAFEPAEWKICRKATAYLLHKVFVKDSLENINRPEHYSAAVMAMTGFTILCDWIGSDDRYFRPEPNTQFDEYVHKSRQRAQKAITDSGLLANAAVTVPADVRLLFHDLGELRPLQLAVNEIPDELLKVPSLTIIEAPTGEGKTEAALALAHRISQATGTEELYYALPTMATSNQMFGRLQTHLRERLGLLASVKLVHGQAFLMEEELLEELPAALIQPLGNGGVPKQSEVSETISWFNTKKRALLAPFGIGTIDQAELASLNVKHAALRMMGLAGKVVIVDEVHAYDTYMTTIIERLLRWLATMNASVILLSATLPIGRRKLLAEAFGVKLDLPAGENDMYPSLLVLSSQGIFHKSPHVWQPDRTIELSELHFGDDDAPAKAEWLLKAIENGGCACWMTNTVRRAQRIYEELQKTLQQTPHDIKLDLLHSQYPLDERQRRESDLTAKYKRGGNRPRQGIVVGTQVLEQSLDLDFDVMVSDLAPVDLLLQRSGRLHRHECQRPAAHATPRLWINYEITPDGERKPGTDRTIYPEFIMRQTHLILQNLMPKQWSLPKQYRPLIEEVYGIQTLPADAPLYVAWKDLQAKEDQAVAEARLRLLPAPHPRDSFAVSAATKIKFEEDENRADWIVAQTRLGGKTINVIPLEKNGNYALLPNTDEKVDLNAKASLEMQRKLLKRNLRISNRAAIEAIEVRIASEETQTKLFKESTLLKGYFPLWLNEGKVEFNIEKGVVHIRLDEALGLVIVKEGRLDDTDD